MYDNVLAIREKENCISNIINRQNRFLQIFVTVHKLETVKQNASFREPPMESYLPPLELVSRVSVPESASFRWQEQVFVGGNILHFESLENPNPNPEELKKLIQKRRLHI